MNDGYLHIVSAGLPGATNGGYQELHRIILQTDSWNTSFTYSEPISKDLIEIPL